jgi:hypothetical protein
MPEVGEFKVCPFCKERIRQTAVKCRFCGEWLETQPENTTKTLPSFESGESSTQAPDVEQAKAVYHSDIPVGSSVVLRPPTQKVGGWLIVLIIGLAFGIPGHLESNIDAVRPLARYVDRFPRLGLLVDIYCYVNWGAALLSLYCAYVLAFKKPAAVTVSKRGMLIIVGVIWTSNLYIACFLRSQAGVSFVLQTSFPSSVWLLIWNEYLRRSKRVKNTYFVGVDTQPDEDERYELLNRATRLETKGRVEEALAAYRELMEKYPDSPAGQDARKSLESLEAKTSH